MAGRGTEDAQRGQGARRECGRGRLERREGGSDGQRGETEGGRVGTTSDGEKRKAGGRKDTGEKQERENRMDAKTHMTKDNGRGGRCATAGRENAEGKSPQNKTSVLKCLENRAANRSSPLGVADFPQNRPFALWKKWKTGISFIKWCGKRVYCRFRQNFQRKGEALRPSVGFDAFFSIYID